MSLRALRNAAAFARAQAAFDARAEPEPIEEDEPDAADAERDKEAWQAEQIYWKEHEQ